MWTCCWCLSVSGLQELRGKALNPLCSLWAEPPYKKQSQERWKLFLSLPKSSHLPAEWESSWAAPALLLELGQLGSRPVIPSICKILRSKESAPSARKHCACSLFNKDSAGFVRTGIVTYWGMCQCVWKPLPALMIHTEPELQHWTNIVVSLEKQIFFFNLNSYIRVARKVLEEERAVAMWGCQAPNGDGRGPVLLAAGIGGAKSLEMMLRWNLGSKCCRSSALGADWTLRTQEKRNWCNKLLGWRNSWDWQTKDLCRGGTSEMLIFFRGNSNGWVSPSLPLITVTLLNRDFRNMSKPSLASPLTG